MPKPPPRWPAYKRIPEFVPVPLRERRDGWTAVRQGEFVGWLAQTGSVAEAAARVGCSRASAYALRRREGARSFADAWEFAASGGSADVCARKLTPDEVANAAFDGMVRVQMWRGRFARAWLVSCNSALLQLLVRFGRSRGMCSARRLQ